MKDLNSDVMKKLDQRLQADNAAMEKFCQFFGLKLVHRFGLITLKDLFPDTTVSLLKKCFEALLLHDLVEILEKVRPRSLRPAVSSEQIEKLRRTDDRPTKYHSDVAVLVVDLTFEEDFVKREHVEKIETFFKDLNLRNEVATISWEESQETQEVLREVKKRPRANYYYSGFTEGDVLRNNLEIVLQEKARLEKELEKAMLMEDRGKQTRSRLEMELNEVTAEEFIWRGYLENMIKEEKQAESYFEKLKELEKEIEKSVSMAMDKWVHNQG